MCEAFLRIPPHFGLWLKAFNVKPVVVDGQHAGCGGAMVSKLPKAIWPKGAFVDTVKIWQQEWFYITEPRDTKWAAAPAFRSGPPLQVASWTNKGLDWGSSDEVLMFKKRIKNIIEKHTSLTDVIQVMLIRRSLPCQRRPLRMWELNPEGPRTFERFFGMTHEAIWKLLFKTQKSWPGTSEDIGLDCNHPPSPVSVTFANITWFIKQKRGCTKNSLLQNRAG